MMQFTDDDLKLLKERMKEADVPAMHVKALIHRLECAEAYIARIEYSDGDWATYPEAKAWRQSAGRGEGA